MTKERVIGKKNALPWYIPEDLKNFKRLTTGNTIIMGRKTFDSIGRPLPNRKNVVISRSMEKVEGVDVCKSVEEGLQKAESYGKDIFIIGGATIYQQTLPLAEKMYISHVIKDYDGDIYFTEFNKEEWSIESREEFDEFELVVYAKK